MEESDFFFFGKTHDQTKEQKRYSRHVAFKPVLYGRMVQEEARARQRKLAIQESCVEVFLSQELEFAVLSQA